MRILYLTPTDVFSGGERVTRDIACEMAARGHTVVYCGIEGPVRQAVEAAGIEFLPLDGFTPASVGQAVGAWKPDLIHTMDFRASTYAALTGAPFLAHLHNDPLWLSGINANSAAMLFFGLRAAHILTVSDSVMEEYRFGSILKKRPPCSATSSIPRRCERRRKLRCQRICLRMQAMTCCFLRG